jgi:hypothetical protein
MNLCDYSWIMLFLFIRGPLDESTSRQDSLVNVSPPSISDVAPAVHTGQGDGGKVGVHGVQSYKIPFAHLS